MALIELDLTRPPHGHNLPPAGAGFGGTVLLMNARWFTRVRWLVSAVFLAVAAVLRFLPSVAGAVGVSPVGLPFWILAAGLGIANTFLTATSRRFHERSDVHVVKAHLWIQIGVDLAAVTYLVHTIGSLDTFVPFAFLFHISLACVFFTQAESMLVVLASAVLYVFTITMETTGVWPPPRMFPQLPGYVWQEPRLALLFALSAVAVWVVIWYFISTLSRVIREREHELNRMNVALSDADREKNRTMITTAHDLKSPFAGIESSIRTLRREFWQDLPGRARTIVERIELRSRHLRERINAILFLGELRSRQSDETTDPASVDLSALISSVVDTVRERAAERQVALDVSVPALSVRGERRAYAALFENIVANAIAYSREGGHVSIVGKRAAGLAVVSVSDRGIGIRADALPHIFEEYYRTSEAARFNTLSTGLGLAIVKEIAQKIGLRIRVDSEEGRGTSFEVAIPLPVSQEVNP